MLFRNVGIWYVGLRNTDLFMSCKIYTCCHNIQGYTVLRGTVGTEHTNDILCLSNLCLIQFYEGVVSYKLLLPIYDLFFQVPRNTDSSD